MHWNKWYVSQIITPFLENRFKELFQMVKHSYGNQCQQVYLRALFFLIYINDLSKSLSSKTKLFADDTSVFSTVENVNVSKCQLNSDLEKNSHWDHQWKMSFNLVPKKQAEVVIFFWKKSLQVRSIQIFTKMKNQISMLI